MDDLILYLVNSELNVHEGELQQITQIYQLSLWIICVLYLLGVAFMDLNGLKEANDELGHDAGDELLISAGQIISQAFGRDYVYRVGGDEFVVLDDQSSRTEFESHCAAFEKALTQPASPSILIGAEWCPDSHYLREAVERADRKMRRQKKRLLQIAQALPLMLEQRGRGLVMKKITVPCFIR
ncbi:GGDEF domain-containing protein [Lactobacillus delbrueckii subsp. bulgaricus]